MRTWKISLLLVFISSAHAEASLGEKRVVFQGSQNQILKVEVKSDQLIHLEYSDRTVAPNLEDSIFTTPMVVKKSFSGPTKFVLNKNVIETNWARLTVVDSTLCVKMEDLNQSAVLGEICAEDLDQVNKRIVIHPEQLENVYGLGNFFYDAQSADGDWVGRDWNAADQGNARYGFLGGAPSMSQFPMLYALGRGFKNFGLFLDHPYRLSWDFRDPQNWILKTWGDRLRMFLLFGRNLPHLRRNYMELVGKPLIPPQDVFGLWVSKFGYSNWQEIKSELKSLRKNTFPVDGFALDLQWFGGTFGNAHQARMGTLSFDTSHFPDPEKTILNFHKNEKIQFMAIEESYVDERTFEYEMLRGNTVDRCLMARASPTECIPVRFGTESEPYWWGRGGMIDWTNPLAGEIWHARKRLPLARLGVLRHWTDLGEPEMYSSDAYYFGIEPNKNRHPDIHNLYNFKWLESIYNGYLNLACQSELKEKLNLSGAPRFFSMSRSGAPGIQRFGAGMWSGDIAKNAGSLRAHLNSQLHLSLAGIDYYSSDVGGFIPSQTGLEQGHNDHELYTQWFANSSLGDVPLRPHTWAYGSDQISVSPDQIGDQASNLFNLRQRYSLFPYLYSLAYRAYQVGDPVFPPLVYYYQNDPKVRSIGNIKMIGDSLLYGVVVGFGQKERRVYLPPGKWVNYHSLDWYDSSGEETPPIPLWVKDSDQKSVFTLPLFLKAGAIIPKIPVSANTLNIAGDQTDGTRLQDRVIQIVADSHLSQFTFFEDDGITLDYLKGDFRTTEIYQQLQNSNGAVAIESIRVGKALGNYTNGPKARKIKIELIVENKQAFNIILDGIEIDECKTHLESDTSYENCWYQKLAHKIDIFSPLLKLDEPHVFEVHMR